jgi:hypothetical protein
MQIPFSNIVEVKPVSGLKVYAYWGYDFATSRKSVIEIARKRGMNIIISPLVGATFVEQLNQVRKIN